MNEIEVRIVALGWLMPARYLFRWRNALLNVCNSVFTRHNEETNTSIGFGFTCSSKNPNKPTAYRYQSRTRHFVIDRPTQLLL